MHSSWLFSGANSGSRQPADSASGDRSSNSNGASFEINSFVRSLNLQGVHLPGGFPFTGVTAKSNNKRERSVPKTGKSLNELLNVLNDSVDRVVECGPHDRSNTSSFGSFRSGVEERDPASLNDLIHLVSTTANEFRDIHAGNGKAAASPARSDDRRYAAGLVNPLEIGMRTLVHPEIRTRDDGGPFNFSTVSETAAAGATRSNNSRGSSRSVLPTENAYRPPLQKRRNSKGVEFDDTPTKDEFFTPPELVEIYSENQRPGVKRANLSAESLETLGYFETPRCFLPEVIRLAKAAGFRDASSLARDRSRSNWMPQPRRINFEDELWPIGPGGSSSKAFSPYFTGSPVKSFRLRTAEKKFDNDTRKSMNSSRSSPIFAGAGEAPAEPLEIVVPTRDREDNSNILGKNEVVLGSSGDRLIPVPIGMFEVPIEENVIDAVPRKLNERDIDINDFVVEERNQKPQTVDANISLNITKEPECAIASVTNEGKAKRKACVKVLTKRHRRICKQSTKNSRKKNSIKTDDEDTCEGNFSSNSPSPTTSPRKSPMQRFLDESGTVGSDEDKLMGSVKGHDYVETQMEICTKISRPNSRFSGKQLKAKPSEMVVAAKNKIPVRCNVLTKCQEAPGGVSKPSFSVETNQNVASSKKLGNLKNIQQKGGSIDSAQPIWKPAGSAKLAPSTSSSSVPRQSRIAQSTPRNRPNTTETLRKYNENAEAIINKSKVPVVRKNQSQDVLAEKTEGRSMARKSEAVVKTSRSRSKQRPGTPKKPVNSECGRCDIKLVPQDRNSRKPLSVRDEISKSSKINGSNLKTTIPVLRSHTFVYQMRRESSVRRVASKEDNATNPKSSSIRSSQNYLTPRPVKQLFQKPPKNCPAVRRDVDLCSDANTEDTTFDSQINTDAEQSCSDFQLSSNSNFDKMCAVDFSSSDSVAVKKITTAVVEKQPKSSVASEESHEGRNNREEEMSKSKFYNKHARSLRMLKNILSHQGVSVEGVNKDAREIRSRIHGEPEKKSRIPSAVLRKPSVVAGTAQSNSGSSAASKTLFEKLAVLTETLPDCGEVEGRNSGEPSVSSFVDCASESATSYSMRDAEEQCCLPYGSSVVSRTSSMKSCESRKPQEITKEVSSISTEIDEVYRRSIYVDAAVSPTPSETERGARSFEAAETQTRVKVVDKNSATEEIFLPVPNSVNVCTETRVISSASQDASTDFEGPENVDATSQVDPAENSRNTACGQDFSSIQCPSKDVNTEPPDIFLKSRGVCFRGPRSFDNASQFDPPEKSKDTASGRDYVKMQSVSEDVNTDRQDYLFEDRSVDVLRPTTAEEACQIDPAPLDVINAAVGDFPVDVKSTPEDIFHTKVPHHLHGIETVVVKDVDVVQWQSSTTFNTSKINCGSSCSSTSSLVAWHSKYFQKPALDDRVPKEAIVALEMANERAQNLFKAIGIYRENLSTKKITEPITQSSKSVEKDQTLIDRTSNVKSTKQFKQTCSFRENSKIKTLLEANLEKLQSETNKSPPQSPEKSAESSKVQEEITSLMDNILTNVMEIVRSKSEYCLYEDLGKNYQHEELLVQRKKCQSSAKLAEILEERNINDKNVSSTSTILEFPFFSRNGLLTVIYGTVCSLVFWALQFSITCDSV